MLPAKISSSKTLTALAVVLALGAATLDSAAAADKLRVGKADSTDYDFALLQVGIDAGIFKKDGLEIETVTLPGAQLHQAMTADSIDLALGSGTDGGDAMRWLDAPDDALFFARDPGFVFAVNLGASAVPLPPHSAVLLASGPLGADDGGLVTLPGDTAAWLAG